MKKFLLLFLIFSALFFSCKKKEHFPIEPNIELVSFTVFGEDSAYFHIKFTDGDGDFGVSTPDELQQNAFIGYYYKNPSGNFVQEELNGNNITWYAYLPNITPHKKDKTLKGEMIFLLDAPLYALHDTMQYDCYITDRAGHKSNVVKSQEIFF